MTVEGSNASLFNRFALELQTMDAFFFHCKLFLLTVIWAIGPLNQRFEVSYHSQFLKKDKFIDFGRQPFWNCPIPENEGKPLLADVENGNQRPQTQKLNQQNINRVDSVKPREPPTQRPVPTPKPVANRDAWEIPPIQCNGLLSIFF